jgi:hypothetical protein
VLGEARIGIGDTDWQLPTEPTHPVWKRPASKDARLTFYAGDNPELMIRQRCVRTFVLGVALTALCVCVAPAGRAQQNETAAGSNSQAQKEQTPQKSGAQTPAPNNSGSAGNQQRTDQPGTSNDRLFWTLPDFLTVKNQGLYPPLTAGQKFKVVARSSFDWVEYPWIGFLAGISQAENSEPEYGQGAEGYAKRYGSTFGDSVIENFMTGAVMPSVLHQDPRYFQLGEGGFWHRTEYAVSRIWVTRSDSGQKQFNFSEIGGAAIAAAISTYSYHPRGDRNVGNTARLWGTQIGLDTITIDVKEFWPDIKRILTKKKSATD